MHAQTFFRGVGNDSDDNGDNISILNDGVIVMMLLIMVMVDGA